MASKRAKAAIAAVVALAAAGGGLVAMSSGDRVPDDVYLASTYLVKPWEGRELRAYADPATGGKPWTICDGDTKNVYPGLVETPAGCDRRLSRRMMEFRAALVVCIPRFEQTPLSWRAMMESLAYNIGGARACDSTAADRGQAGDFIGSCKAATWFNRAGGRVMIGLKKRREFGDAQRIGEQELCQEGL
jgi:lysozyme